MISFPPCIVYQPRNPKASAYYKCVENHFDNLERAWDDMYASRYGFWRTYVITVIYKYLDCGDLHMGFARIRCDGEPGPTDSDPGNVLMGLGVMMPCA